MSPSLIGGRRAQLQPDVARRDFLRISGGAGKMEHLDFPKIAKGVGIGAIEYVNQFFKDKAKDLDSCAR